MHYHKQVIQIESTANTSLLHNPMNKQKHNAINQYTSNLLLKLIKL